MAWKQVQRSGMGLKFMPASSSSQAPLANPMPTSTSSVQSMASLSKPVQVASTAVNSTGSHFNGDKTKNERPINSIS